jgi:hypothetical protein
MMSWKPDRLNGKVIFRGYDRAPDGVLIQSGVIMHPPSVKVGRAPIQHPDEMVEMALRDLITVSEQTGDPVIKAQAVMFRKNLKKFLVAWLARAAVNEREMILTFLEQHGFTEAAKALTDG